MTGTIATPNAREQIKAAGRELFVWLVPPIAPAIGLTFIAVVALGGLGLVQINGREVGMVFAASYVFTSGVRLQHLAEKGVETEGEGK